MLEAVYYKIPILYKFCHFLIAVFLFSSLDDFTLGDPEDVMDDNIRKITEAGERIGLHLNTAKCEIVHASDVKLTSHLLNSFANFTSKQLHWAHLFLKALLKFFTGKN